MLTRTLMLLAVEREQIAGKMAGMEVTISVSRGSWTLREEENAVLHGIGCGFEGVVSVSLDSSMTDRALPRSHIL